MAGQTIDFATQVSSWVLGSKQRMLAVFQMSIQATVEIMQETVGEGGNMPVITGFLRASLRGFVGNISSLASISPKGGTVSYDGASVSMAISNLQLGDTFTAIYLANYAMRVNYGFVGKDRAGREYNQNGRLFVELAAQRWPSTVRRMSAEAKARAKP